MSTTAIRAHVMLPPELIKAIDRIAGPRGRSQFMAAAVREKLIKAEQDRAFREAAGSIDLASHPEWSTPEKTSEWVRASRRADDESLERKLRRTPHE